MTEFPPIAIGAVVAALITGLVSLLGLVISKEQKISEFRQAWIDSLRSELAELISYANSIHGAETAAFESTKDAWKTLRDDFVGINQAAASIRLRLNPKEKEAKAVLEIIETLEMLLSPSSSVDYSELNSVEKDLIAKAQLLLKNEWRRVRKGEVAYRMARVFAMLLLSLGLIASFLFMLIRLAA